MGYAFVLSTPVTSTPVTPTKSRSGSALACRHARGVQSRARRHSPALTEMRAGGVVDVCRSKIGSHVKLAEKTVAATALALSLTLGAPQLAGADVPDTLPRKYFIDDVNSVQQGNQNYVEKVLSRLQERTGYKVHFLLIRSFPFGVTPDDYAKEVFQQWGCGDSDVVVIAGLKIAKAGIATGSTAEKLLTPSIAESIGTETFPFKATEEMYSTAVGDVTDRIVTVLDGKQDYGPPKIVRESGEGTFKSRETTGRKRNKYVTVVVALLAASFIIPMVQYYWYVKDD